MLKSFKPYLLLVALGIFVPIVTSLFWPSNSWSIVGPIKFQKDIQLNSISQMLTILLLIATFLERALEVYVLTFRRLGEEQCASDELAKYKDKTRKIALFSALLIGILISMTGIRGIEPFIDFEETTHWQRTWFQGLDIFLTGGVIAGGSDFIHKILNTVTTFMDAITASQKSTEAASNASTATSKAQEIKSNAEAAKVVENNQKTNTAPRDTLGDTLQDT
jgi:hypothetical protein